MAVQGQPEWATRSYDTSLLPFRRLALLGELDPCCLVQAFHACTKLGLGICGKSIRLLASAPGHHGHCVAELAGCKERSSRALIGELGRDAEFVKDAVSAKDNPTFVLPLGLFELAVLLDAQVKEVAEVGVDVRLAQLLLSFCLDAPQRLDRGLVPCPLSTVLGAQFRPLLVYCGLCGGDLRPLFPSDRLSHQTVPIDQMV